MEEEKRWSFKRAIKNTFTWDKDDWKYIKNHIVWLLVILLLSFLYYSEVKQARIYIGSPCVHQCLVKNYIEEYKSLNPDIQIQCDYELGTCMYSGVLDNQLNEFAETLRGLNMSISNG